MTLRRVVFLGAPGAGKGTQASRACETFGLAHLSTGDLLRVAVKNGTAAGKQAKRHMEAGELVPDDVVFGVLFERLDGGHEGGPHGFVLDGFPRNMAQAEGLDERLGNADKPLDGVINIVVPLERLVERITGRRVCSGCGATYHVRFKPPAAEGACDACSAPIVQRSDDTEAVVAQRLEVYREQTEPLEDFYRNKGLLISVDGDRGMDEVASAVRDALAGEPAGGRLDG